MKISIFVLTIGFLQVAANSYGQDTKLTIKESSVALETLLTQIESQSEFFFFYNNDRIDKSMKVSVDASNKTIAAILNQVLEGTNIMYQVVNRAIILAEKTTMETISQQSTVTGIVTDNTGPMPGVNVVVKGTTTGVVTDNNGRYSITIPYKEAVLGILYKKYIQLFMRSQYSTKRQL